MSHGDRLPWWAFGVSVGLHLLLVIGLPEWTRSVSPQPEAPRVTRYVMRFHQPAPTPPPVVTPIPTVTPPPIDPVPVIPPVQVKIPEPIPVIKPVPLKPRKPNKPLKKVERKRPKPPRRKPVTPKPPPPKPQVAPPPPVQPTPPQVAKLEPQPPTQNAPVSSPPQPSSAAQDALSAYLSLISETLEKHKRYPKYARKRSMNGRVVLKFIVLPDGRVVDPQVAQSAGHKSFRTAALRALSRAGQMPPFPSDIRRSRLVVEIPIAYKIRKR